MPVGLLKSHLVCNSKVLLFTKENAPMVAKKIATMSEKETFTIIHKKGCTEVIRTPFGIFYGNDDISLVSNSLESFVGVNIWTIPKPRIKDLETIIALDRKVYEKYWAEFFCSLCWNTKKEKYEIYVPKQSVSGASVKFDQISMPKHLVQVIDHHSHNTMGAFFSNTDDANDAVRFKISMVIGKIKSAEPEIKMRLIMSGKIYEIALSSVFEDTAKANIENLFSKVVKDKIDVLSEVKFSKKSKFNNPVIQDLKYDELFPYTSASKQYCNNVATEEEDEQYNKIYRVRCKSIKE